MNPDQIMTTAKAVALVKSELAGVFWEGILWQPRSCKMCEKRFWKATCDKSNRIPKSLVHRKNGVYCSDKCRLIGYGELSAARQARYQLRVRMKLVSGPTNKSAAIYRAMTTAERRQARTLHNNRKIQRGSRV